MNIMRYIKLEGSNILGYLKWKLKGFNDIKNLLKKLSLALRTENLLKCLYLKYYVLWAFSYTKKLNARHF